MIQRNLVHLLNVAIREYRSPQASSSIWASEASLARTRERGASPLARETCFTRPNRRACSQVMSIAATSPSFVILHYFNNRCLIFYQRMSWRARLPREYPSFRWAGASCLSKLKFFFKPLNWRRFAFKLKYWAILFKYILFVLFFCLLLHRLAVRISLPFYDFVQVIIVLIQVYNWEILHHSTVCRCRLADILYLSKLVNHNYNKIWLAINYPDFSTNSTV